MRGAGIAFLAGDGGDVDNAAVAGGDHVRHHGPAHQIGRVQVDLQDLTPDPGIQLPGRRVAAGNAGAVHDDVQARMRGKGRLGCRLDGRLVGQLHDVSAYNAQCGKLVRAVLYSSGIDIPQGHPRPGTQEPLSGRKSDAAGAAGDDRDAA